MKRLFWMLTIAMCCAGSADARTYFRGDANIDGVVDVSDVTAEVNIILGTKSAGYNPIVVDINADRSFDVSDVTSLINSILE